MQHGRFTDTPTDTNVTRPCPYCPREITAPAALVDNALKGHVRHAHAPLRRDGGVHRAVGPMVRNPSRPPRAVSVLDNMMRALWVAARTQRKLRGKQPRSEKRR